MIQGSGNERRVLGAENTDEHVYWPAALYLGIRNLSFPISLKDDYSYAVGSRVPTRDQRRRRQLDWIETGLAAHLDLIDPHLYVGDETFE